MKNSIFWNITPCSPLKVNQHLEEHVTSIFRTEELAKQETSMKLVASRPHFLLGSFFSPDDGGCISQKTELFSRFTFLQPRILSVSYIPDDVSSGKMKHTGRIVRCKILKKCSRLYLN
jgi:hypothetical protein